MFFYGIITSVKYNRGMMCCMKKNIKIILLIFMISISLSVIFFILKNKKLEANKGLINVSSLSEQFMERYFKEIKEISDYDNKENILIVTSKKGIREDYGASKIIEGPNNQYFIQYDSKEQKEKALEKMQGDRYIVSIDENIVYTIEESNYNSWGIEKMSLDYAINSSNLASLNDVTVAIIDTGCDLKLFNKYYSGKILETYNVLEDSTESMNDKHGHGTHIAGTIAEGTPSNVKILPVKVSNTGNLYNTDIIAAINYITYYEKADVINMSFGSYGYSESIDQAIESANQKNIISVAAAGNKNTSRDHYPSSLDNTISIASVDSELNKSSFSNYGSMIDFAAPGTSILSINGVMSGTSMATPHAVSAIAILKSYNKDLTLDNVIELLKLNAIDLGDEGWDQYFGHGLISFANVNFCDDTYCDEYGVFKSLSKSITNIELVELKFTKYNYYSLTNLMGSLVKVYFSDETTEELLLGDISNLVVLNYDATEEKEQTITIKIDDISLEINVTNPSNYESGWEYNILSNDKVELNGYKSHGLDINRLYIPETIHSKKVVSFADGVRFNEFGDDFSSYDYLYLPLDFSRIGNYSLAKTSIKFIYGDSNGVEIGSHALKLSSLVTIDIPIIKIEDYAFKDVYDLVYVNVSNNVIDIGDYAFYNCKKLIEVNNLKDNASKGLYRVGKYAFYNCISLSQFDLEILGDIDEYAFANCFNLISLDLYQSDSIGKYAFYNSGISEAKLGLIDVISESSFENCKNLTSMKVTSGRIESRAFWNSNVESVFIGSLVEYIAEDAFAYAPVKNSDGGNGGSGTYNAIYGLGIVDLSNNKLIVGFTEALGISNTEIPDYITEIGNYAFTGNNTLEKIIIPSNVVKIGDYAFKDCYHLSNVYILGNNIEFGDDVFTRTHEGEIKNNELVLYVYKNSDVKKYVVNNNLGYRHIEPDDVIVTNEVTSYEALKYVDLEKVSVKLVYYEEEIREEELSIINYIDAPISRGVGFYVSYQNGYKFQYGDTYYIVNAKNALGYEVTKKIDVNVYKASANYEYDSSDNTIVYDGKNHGINLTVSKPTNAQILYMDKTGNYTLKEMPTYSEMGTYIIKYKIYIDNNYEEVYGENILTILDFSSLNKSTDYEGLYDGKEHTFNLDLSLDDYTIKYSINNFEYDLNEMPKFTEIGEYIVNYKVIYGSNVEFLGSNKVKIYGIEKMDESLLLKDNILLITDQENSLIEISKKINIYSKTSTITHFDKNNNIINTDTIKTGDRIIIYINNFNYAEYTISLLGDVTGDGLINIADVIKIADHTINQNVLVKDYEKIASDVTGDNIINIADVVKIADYTLDNSIKLWI